MADSINFDKAINELMKDYKKAAVIAAKYATEKVKEDIYNKALDCLKTYYGYYDPSSYNRTERLKDSFVPFSNISINKNNIICSAGIIYDFTKLDGYYSTNGYGRDGWGDYRRKSEIDDAWRHGGDVEPSWIVDNYLSGIHPRTNGSSNPMKVKYIPKRDCASPTVMMKLYFNYEALKNFNNYMKISFAEQALKFL